MATLSFTQIEQLWIANGGSAALAPVMAAIAIAESGGRTDAHNPKPPDDSYGLWQINYYGNLRSGRTQRYGSPDQLVADPNLQARAAISLAGNGSGLRNWTTYTSGAYKAPLAKGSSGSAVGSGELAAGPNIQFADDEVAPGKGFNSGATDDTEGHWTIGAGPVQFTVQRSTFRKVAGFGVLLLGGGVVLIGTGWLAKGAAISSVTKPITKGLQQRSSNKAAVAQTQIREDAKLQRQQEAAQEKRSRRQQDYLSAREEGERAAEEAGPF